MANVIKRGESILIPFENGESVRDSQSKPRIYRSKEQYERFGYLSRGAELVEYAEVVRCKDCKMEARCKVTQWLGEDGFCSDGERREGE